MDHACCDVASGLKLGGFNVEGVLDMDGWFHPQTPQVWAAGRDHAYTLVLTLSPT